MSYQVKLKQFEGPMDLLLHLVQKAKVQIEDIFISRITEQYLEYVDKLEAADMESASEFLIIAAYLLEIKSRSLLPRSAKASDDEPTAEQLEEMLIEKLEEYSRFKTISGQLQNLEQMQMQFYTKLPEELPKQDHFQLEGLTVDGLQEAFLRVLNRVPVEQQVREQRISRESFSIEDSMRTILYRLQSQDRVQFHDLFEQAASRAEIVTIFIALLELLKLSELHIDQKRPFSTIWIHKHKKRLAG